MLDDVPDGSVSYVVVFVDYSVSEADDCLVASDLSGDGWIVVGKSVGGFADDFELPLDCGAQERTFFVLFERDFSGLIDYELCRFTNVAKVIPDFNFHRWVL